MSRKYRILNGNEACTLGALAAGMNFYAGYPITPATEIMENYGAVNAANMDGGSSSALVINNKIINTPVAGGKDGLRDIPTFWIVK